MSLCVNRTEFKVAYLMHKLNRWSSVLYTIPSTVEDIPVHFGVKIIKARREIKLMIPHLERAVCVVTLSD